MASATVKPVVVGIDGSDQSTHAALWAADEAAGLGVSLRLVYVVRTDLTGTLSADEYRVALTHAKSAVHDVRDRIEAVQPAVPVVIQIAQGSPAGVLLAESPDAAMICVGSSGIGRLGQAMLGSTAATLAGRASCSVAIIRSPDHVATEENQIKWVMVPVNIFSDNDDVIDAAIDQARLLRRPVLTVGVWHPGFGASQHDDLERLVAQWQERYPDVHIHPVANGTRMSRFLNAHPDLSGVVVIDESNADEVAAIIGAGHRSHSDDIERAVLVARNYADDRWASPPSSAPVESSKPLRTSS